MQKAREAIAWRRDRVLHHDQTDLPAVIFAMNCHVHQHFFACMRPGKPSVKVKSMRSANRASSRSDT